MFCETLDALHKNRIVKFTLFIIIVITSWNPFEQLFVQLCTKYTLGFRSIIVKGPWTIITFLEDIDQKSWHIQSNYVNQIIIECLPSYSFMQRLKGVLVKLFGNKGQNYGNYGYQWTASRYYRINSMYGVKVYG